MLKIDQYAYINRLSDVHPLEKIILATVTMIICLGFSSPAVSLAVLLLMSAATVLVAGIPARFFLKLMLLPFSFLVIGVLTVAVVLTGDPHPLLYWVRLGGYCLGVTASSLHLAVNLFLKSLGAVACLYFLSLTVHMVELFAVLRKVRIPALFVELMSLIYRFIFVLLETTDKIYIAQSTRWGYANLKTSYRSLGQLVSNLLRKSYSDSQMLYLTLTSRGYSGELKVLEREYTFSIKNLVIIAVVDSLLLLLGLWSTGILKIALGGGWS